MLRGNQLDWSEEGMLEREEIWLMSQKNDGSEIKVADTFPTKMSFLIMGFGNLVHKQFVKGAGFLAIEIGFILFMIMGGAQNIINFFTLGTVETHDEFVPGKILPVRVFGDNSMPEGSPAATPVVSVAAAKESPRVI